MSIQLRTATLADAVLPRTGGLARDALLIAGSGIVLAALAQVSIPLPFTPVPITGQTLGVLLVGALLGSRRGALAMLAYLGEGLAGWPVFAGGTSAWSPSALGVPVIVGPTAGYLLAFPLAAFVVGALAERGWDRQVGSTIAMMAVGNVVIYLFGLAWLGQYVGYERVLALGLAPYLPGDAAKVLIAAAALPSGWRLLRARGDAGPGTPSGS